MPYYIRLCIETWKKFLPEAEIIVLDFGNLGNYARPEELGTNLLSGKFSFMHISDAVRVLMLEKYGGIWLDADTVILSSGAKKYFVRDENYPVTFFGKLNTNSCPTCFINALPHTKMLREWLEFIRERINNPDSPPSWDYFSNAFTDEYFKNHPDEIKRFDILPVMPEESEIQRSVPDMINNYLEYYFFTSKHIEDVDAEMLFLHNSWVPLEFKIFGREEFLRCNFTLANVLMATLDLKRNLKANPIIYQRPQIAK